MGRIGFELAADPGEVDADLVRLVFVLRPPHLLEQLAVTDELACVPCVAKACANKIDLECMLKITPDEVFVTVVDMLKAMGRLP